MIYYRDAAVADADALAALFAASFSDTFGHLYDPADLASFLADQSPADWARELADPAFAVRVAESDGAMIGFAKLGPPHLPFVSGPGAIELRQLYILTPWHGRGVAACLTDWLIASARSRRASDLFLSVFVDNHRAQRFYQRYGFEAIGPYTFMVGNHADEDIVMRLAL
jgi:diamine N-acetyltransferase